MLYFKEKIPKDWQTEPIANLIENYQQGFASGARDNDGILQLRMNNITTGGRIILDRFLRVPIPDNIDNYLLKKDDVIFNNTNSVKLIGKTAIFSDECDYCTFSNHLTRLRANKSKVSPHWLLYHFNQAWRKHYFRRICNAHVNQAGVKRGDIENFKIPLPKLSEQIIIISIINSVQNLIGKINIIIDQLQILKKGLMQRLFTEGIGHTEFKETRVGRIPKGWEIVTMSKIGKVISGGTPDTNNETYWNGHISWATPTDVTNLQGKFISQTNRNISNEGLNKSSAKILPPFSLLMTSRASIGYCAINTREMCTNQGFQSIIPNENIDAEFLYYIIQSFKVQNQLVRLAYGSTFSEIPNKDAKKVKIPLPKLDEQQKIISILSNLDNKIMKENQIKSILKEVKKGLMQSLLTGKKRVKIKENN